MFVHDAVDYMLTEADLRAAMETAFVHCRPGGLALFVPDDTARDRSSPGPTTAATTAPTAAAPATWSGPGTPTPTTRWSTTEYAFVLRDADGSVRVVHETHRTGLFGRDVWLGLLAEAGFEPRAALEETTEDRPPRAVHRPPAARLSRRQDGSIQRSPSRTRSASDGPHVSRK